MENEQNQNTQTYNEKQEKRRYNIAVSIIWPSMLFLFVLSIITAVGGWNTDDLYSSVLPLLGTWMGAVIAFYFSKDNLESAQRTVENLVSKVNSTAEKLKNTLVKEVMIPKSKIAFFEFGKDKTEADYTVRDLLIRIEENGRNRLPIFNNDGSIRFVVHRSILDKYLSKASLSDDFKDKVNPADTTLEELFKADADTKKLFESYSIVKESDTLATAKTLMDRKTNCLDIFVNEKGGESEAVTGWITNIEIAEHSKVQTGD